MRSLRKQFAGFVAAGLFALLVGGAFGATVPSGTVNAADCSGNNALLTLPAWYRGIAVDNGNNGCDILSPSDVSQSTTGNTDNIAPFIWIIVSNVTEIALQLIAYIAGFFVIYGGFLYMTSSGSADQAAKALKTIINALVGIAIAVGSVAIVNLLLAITGLDAGYTTTSGGFELPQRDAGQVVTDVIAGVGWVAAVVAIIVIIVAGISYATSAGDAGKVAKAKNAILYAAIGLVVVIVAFTLTNFIRARLGG